MVAGVVTLGLVVVFGLGLMVGHRTAERRNVDAGPMLLLPPNNVRVHAASGTGGLYLTMTLNHVDDLSGAAVAGTAFDVSPDVAARLRDELTFQLDAIASGEPFTRPRDVPLDDR